MIIWGLDTKYGYLITRNAIIDKSEKKLLFEPR